MFTLIAIIFVLGYLMIAFEHSLKIDKAASALLTAVFTWTALALTPVTGESSIHELRHHLGEIAEILFFLLGAMTIVELVDAHDGFKIITERISAQKKTSLLWVLSILTFFLSAILDNLTTTIVMIALVRKLVGDPKERWFYVGMVVIAANAGGAWSPIGDVTTTMLWIGNQITSLGIMGELFIPSMVCLLVPLIYLSFMLKGNAVRPNNYQSKAHQHQTSAFERNMVFALGVGALVFVPVFKTITHLPPYMGILLGVGVLWVATAFLHHGKHDDAKQAFSVGAVLQRIDTPSILFFLGILLAVSSLATGGHLTEVAGILKAQLGNIYAINVAIGLLSSVIDNVPLVAGAMKMYPLVSAEQLAAVPLDQAAWVGSFVQDGNFWELLAYCAGTGGSCLIIGSAAGVAAMGMEKIPFFWYLKNISLLALLGYFAGVGVYIVLAA